MKPQMASFLSHQKIFSTREASSPEKELTVSSLSVGHPPLCGGFLGARVGDADRGLEANCVIINDVDLLPENDFNAYLCADKYRTLNM